MRTLGNKSGNVTVPHPSRLATFAAPLLAVVFALAVGVFTQQAAAKPPSGGGSAGNSTNAFAVGGITLATGDHVAFAAQKNPNTNTYSGYVVQDLMTGSRSGPVTCVYISGNMARVIWIVKHSDNSSEIGTEMQFDVTDNGEPVMGVPTDTYMDLGGCNGQNQPSCDCSTTSGGGPTLLHGNIIVKGP